MQDDIRAILTNPEVFPVDISLTSGETIRIEHPDYVHYAEKLGRIFFYPKNGGGVFELIVPDQIAKVRGKVRKSARWFHLFTGSSE